MPRVLPGAEPDGERILNWRQLYDLPELPPELVVVGSGVTGAEFASAYQALGSQVTLVSSRERVLPHEDADAAVVLEDVFRRRGMMVLSRSRATAVKRTRDGVVVTLEGGRTVRGSHCLLTVGMVPATRDLGLEEAGVTLDGRGFVEVDRVSRTTARGVYAAGDCTGVMMLASVAAMQGRIAMWHTLGEAVQPIRLDHVAATIFTDPEIATVGVTANAVESGAEDAVAVKLPLATNARAKMQGFRDGFVKLFARRGTGIVLGGVVVAPRASELILGVSLAVEQSLTVDQMAHTFAVYPSLSGSLTEAARGSCSRRAADADPSPHPARACLRHPARGQPVAARLGMAGSHVRTPTPWSRGPARSCTVRLPPRAASRSRMPCRPEPVTGPARSKPAPSSVTRNVSRPPACRSSTVVSDAAAYFATFCRASSTQKYTVASASRGSRPTPSASRCTGVGARSACARSAAARPRSASSGG